MNTKSQEQSQSSRVARRRGKTRERILAVAARLFSAHGIDGVTLSDVADAADVSRGNLYSHFGSKEELVQAVCKPIFAHTLEQYRALAELPPAQAIESIIRTHLTIWREFPGALSVAHQLQGTVVEHTASAHSTHPREALEVFERAAEAGLLRVEPLLAFKMLNTIAVPLLELCQDAAEADELFVASMLRLLLKK
jgi:AcrR family transcriptional regulator